MSVAKFDKTILVTVTSIQRRDELIRRMYANLTKEPDRNIIVVKDQINRIQMYHNLGKGGRILIRTYLVIVVPIVMDLRPLDAVVGQVHYILNDTIKALQDLIVKLQSLNGERFAKGTSNAKIFEQLVRSLYSTNGEY